MLNKFKKVLVANRGEIAIRIFRACNELGIRSVGIYSKEDKYSLFRTKADESYLIGKDKGPIDAYLDIDGIIELAKAKNVDAIHPGYGFLSENPEFVRKCEENGIVFIGPSAEIMESMGDKINSKKIAHKVNVGTIPGVEKVIKSVEEAKEVANYIGYPVMIKASNGGGGRGMRVVYDEKNLAIEYQNACSESKKAFGDDLIFIEKYIEDPKHVEVQILGDKYGNLVHLYERDCSVQRRHQKIIEYAPAFSVDPKVREEICRDAVKIAKEVGYVSAGTLEFLVDNKGNHYFIEMNPRIQVEHTVTEEITGIDIVQSQILIAEGYKLDSEEIDIKSQEDIKLLGYAIQCRITTEDPKNNFMPDTGKIQVYRTGSGAGIRLDGGNGCAGFSITPYYDSLLVKTIAFDRTFEKTINKTIRSLKEIRVRGVKTNVGFLINVLEDPMFKAGKCSTKFIDEHPRLFDIKPSKNRGTKLLQFIGDVIVNENKCIPKPEFQTLHKPRIVEQRLPKVEGSRVQFEKLGKKAYIEKIKNEKKLLLTDTTMRDAHQSLIATRFRTYDLMQVAKQTNEYQKDLFSLEMWGGATFDVAYRFLKESPWRRLQALRKEIPDIMFQMLFRASNGVGYTNYPDNVIVDFIKESAYQGIDVIRIFDSLNWIENMKLSIQAGLETGKIVEGTMCYTGDILDPTKSKYNLDYYIRMAKELESLGADIICIKDMAGLLKPYAAYNLIKALKDNVKAPIHLHTHDTSGNGVATCLMASQAGVDIIDSALQTMSGLTSQPSLNAIVEALRHTERDTNIDLYGYEELSSYYGDLRQIYKKFESGMQTSFAEIYNYEMPGGQYSNLKAQADSFGLGDFDILKDNYKEANQIVGDIIKVTPSSKVVGDLAIFMTKNKLNKDNIIEEGKKLSFPDSVVDYCKGMIGQPEGGIPKDLQKVVLKGEEPITVRPGELIPQADFDKDKDYLNEKFEMKSNIRNILSYELYPKVYEEYLQHLLEYNDISKLESDVFFYGLAIGEECDVEIEEGKTLTISLRNIGEVKENGYRTIVFDLNGMHREVEIKDNNYSGSIKQIEVADMNDPLQIGASIPGKVVKILVKEGEEVEKHQPLIVIEAMKMETNIVSKTDGKIKEIKVKQNEMVSDKQLLMTLE